MNVEVHFGGRFISTQGGQKYVGGKCEEIKDFDTDKFSWFELRYMLKKLGVISNYKVLCLRPNESFESGLEPVHSDKCVLRILDYLGVDQNIVLYIEHLVEGSDKELLPEYCLRQEDDPKDVVPTVLVVEDQLKPCTIASGKNIRKKKCASKLPRSQQIIQSPSQRKNPVFKNPRLRIPEKIHQQQLARFKAIKLKSLLGTPSSVALVASSVTAPSVVSATPSSVASEVLKTPPSTPPSTTSPPSAPRRRSPRFISATLSTASPPAIASPSSAARRRSKSLLGTAAVSVTPTPPTEYVSATWDPSIEHISSTPPPSTEHAAATPPPSSEHAAATPPPSTAAASAHISTTPPPSTTAASTYISTTPPPSTSAAAAGLRRSPRLLNRGSYTGGDNEEWSDETWSKYMQQVEDELAKSLEPTSKPHNSENDLNEDNSDEDYAPEEESLPDVDSEGAASGSLHSNSSEEDEDHTSIPKYSEFRVSDMNNIDMEVGMQFEGPDEFRKAIRDHAINNGFDLLWQKNEGVRISVKCRAQGCPFRVYCSWNTKRTRYCIKSLHSEHTCYRALSNQQVTKRWLAKKYLEHFRSDPNMKWNILKDLVQRDIGVSIGQHTCYRVRKLALEELEGKNDEQYNLLWDYAHVLLKTNPGSYIKVKTKPIPNSIENVQFEAMFVSFAAMLSGLLTGCRPVIGMDGCHLTSCNGGILLSAVSRDPNNQMYPVAYAIVEVENKLTWSWLIKTLLDALGVANVEGWTFICDRQKGLVESLKMLVPRAEVRFCVRHLYSNFKERFKGLKLKRLLWEAAGAYTVEEHTTTMKEIKNLRLEAYEYLEAIEKQLWARCYFSTFPKCDLLTNNICESWNKFILAARDKPILSMLEMIRRLIMRRYERKRQISENTTCLGGNIREKLKEMDKRARKCTPYQAEPNLFEVVEKDNQVVVNLNDQTCTCKQWQMTGIPCRHVMCCIQHLRMKPEDFVHEFYKKDRYIASYRGIIYPIADKSTWEKQFFMKILPPIMRKQPGRPKKCRKRGKDEAPKTTQHMSRKGQIIRCSKCKQLGHNKTSCKSPAQGTVSNVPNIARGRKRSIPSNSTTHPSSSSAISFQPSQQCIDSSIQ